MDYFLDTSDISYELGERPQWRDRLFTPFGTPSLYQTKLFKVFGKKTILLLAEHPLYWRWCHLTRGKFMPFGALHLRWRFLYRVDGIPVLDRPIGKDGLFINLKDDLEEGDCF